MTSFLDNFMVGIGGVGDALEDERERKHDEFIQAERFRLGEEADKKHAERQNAHQINMEDLQRTETRKDDDFTQWLEGAFDGLRAKPDKKTFDRLNEEGRRLHPKHFGVSDETVLKAFQQRQRQVKRASRQTENADARAQEAEFGTEGDRGPFVRGEGRQGRQERRARLSAAQLAEATSKGEDAQRDRRREDEATERANRGLDIREEANRSLGVVRARPPAPPRPVVDPNDIVSSAFRMLDVAKGNMPPLDIQELRGFKQMLANQGMDEAQIEQHVAGLETAKQKAQEDLNLAVRNQLQASEDFGTGFNGDEDPDLVGLDDNLRSQVVLFARASEVQMQQQLAGIPDPDQKRLFLLAVQAARRALGLE